MVQILTHFPQVWQTGWGLFTVHCRAVGLCRLPFNPFRVICSSKSWDASMIRWAWFIVLGHCIPAYKLTGGLGVKPSTSYWWSYSKTPPPTQTHQKTQNQQVALNTGKFMKTMSVNGIHQIPESPVTSFSPTQSNIYHFLINATWLYHLNLNVIVLPFLMRDILVHLIHHTISAHHALFVQE